MAGNVWEWVSDSYGDTAARAPAQDGVFFAATASDARMRGGFWRSGANDLRAAARASAPRTAANHDRGFRLVRTHVPLTCEQTGCTAANRTCAVFDERATCGACVDGYEASDGACLPRLAAPTLTATTNLSDMVQLSWTAVPRATSYSVFVDGELAAATTDRAWEDVTAAKPTPMACSTAVTASQSTSVAHVALSCTGSRIAPGAARRYTVQPNYYSEWSGALSVSRDGFRSTTSAPSLQWEFGAGSTWTAIAGATAATYNDTAAPADGTSRIYRVTASWGGDSAQSSAVTGQRRLPAPTNLTATSTTTGVNLAWTAVPGAVRYDVRLPSAGEVFPTLVPSLGWRPATLTSSITRCASLTATTNLSGRVELSCTGASASSSTVNFEVFAQGAGGFAGASSTVGGSARPTVTYQWSRAPTGTTTFTNLSGLTTAAATDTTAVANTTYDYRVVLSASGASAVTSATVQGRALP